MRYSFRKYIPIAFTIFLIIGQGSCTQQPKQTPIYLNADFKNYYDYQVGSYWIFYDSLNSNTDSMYVNSLSYLSPYYNGTTPQENLFINITIDSSTYNDIGIKLNLTALYYCGLSIEYIDSIYYTEIEYPDLTNNIPFDTGKIIINAGNFDGYYQNTFINTFQIGNTLYHNVYKIQYYNSIDLSLDIFYINADDGFLAILLNNKYAHKQLYLLNSFIIK